MRMEHISDVMGESESSKYVTFDFGVVRMMSDSTNKVDVGMLRQIVMVDYGPSRIVVAKAA